MSRPLLCVKVVVAILAIAALGCDSILGEPQSASVDGGGCTVIYIYVDGGVAPTAVDAAGEGGGEKVLVDAAEPVLGVDGGGVTAVDAMATIDEGTSIDAFLQASDGAGEALKDTSGDLVRDLRGDAFVADVSTPDATRDLRGADSVDSPLDSAPPKLDVAADAADSSRGFDADVPAVLDVPSGVDGSDVFDAAAGRDMGLVVSSDAPTSDRAPFVIDGPPSPVDVDGPVVVAQVSTGAYHGCARRNDGVVYCWGENLAGQSAPPPGAFFAQIDSAYNSNCGVKLDRTLACWGDNTQGQTTPPFGEFLQVAMGSSHACGIKTDGTVACWGFNGAGQGNAPVGTFVQLSAGTQHTCGIQTDGSTVCWGGNAGGQSTVPAGDFVQVSARRLHTCARKVDNTLACWGSNGYGESTPPPGDFAQVAAGYFHACGIRDDGTVTCWGANIDGRSTPPLGTFLHLSAEDNHTCGVRNDGTVTCWGSDSSGQSSPP